MKAVMMGAMVVQLAMGGAGASSGRSRPASEPKGGPPSTADVGKHYSALKNEWKSLKQEFQAAREQARREAEANAQPPTPARD